MNMSEVVVLVSLVARPGMESDAEEFLGDLLAPTHVEEGCVLYSLHRGIDEPTRFAFVERWASRELLERHMASEHIQTALGRVDELFSEGPDIKLYDSVPGGATDKGSLAGTPAG
jgi:quinol monooxygenase YgiN